jgi:hypothetical protein
MKRNKIKLLLPWLISLKSLLILKLFPFTQRSNEVMEETPREPLPPLVVEIKQEKDTEVRRKSTRKYTPRKLHYLPVQSPRRRNKNTQGETVSEQLYEVDAIICKMFLPKKYFDSHFNQINFPIENNGNI